MNEQIGFSFSSAIHLHLENCWKYLSHVNFGGGYTGLSKQLLQNVSLRALLSHRRFATALVSKASVLAVMEN